MRKTGRSQYLDRLLVGAALCLVCIAAVAAAAPKQKYSTLKEYYGSKYPAIRSAGMADFMQYSYGELFSHAQTVAVVTPADELTAENTFGVAKSGDIYYNLHSVRKVKALEYFKNEKEYGDTFEMAEECGLLANGTMVKLEDCWPMQKGDVYLVFLKESGFDYPLAISACNGKFDLTHLDLNCRDHSEVLFRALLDLDLLTEKSVRQAGEALLRKAAYARPVNWPKDEERAAGEAAIRWRSCKLYTKWTDRSYPLNLRCGDDEDGPIYSYLQTVRR